MPHTCAFFIIFRIIFAAPFVIGAHVSCLMLDVDGIISSVTYINFKVLDRRDEVVMGK